MDLQGQTLHERNPEGHSSKRKLHLFDMKNKYRKHISEGKFVFT